MKRFLIRILIVLSAFAVGGCGGGGGSISTQSPPEVSLTGDWHLVATLSNTTNDDGQIVIEIHFNSQNVVTSAFAFTNHLPGPDYTAGVPCAYWPQQPIIATVDGQTVSLTMGSYQFDGTVSQGSITGSFTSTCAGIEGGSITATSVGSIPATSFTGITDCNSFETSTCGGACLYQNIQTGILTSQSSNVTFSGTFNCTQGGGTQDFGMQGTQAGYASLLTGTFGSTVAFYPPPLPGTGMLYLFNPQTGSSGGALPQK